MTVEEKRYFLNQTLKLRMNPNGPVVGPASEWDYETLDQEVKRTMKLALIQADQVLDLNKLVDDPNTCAHQWRDECIKLLEDERLAQHTMRANMNTLGDLQRQMQNLQEKYMENDPFLPLPWFDEQPQEMFTTIPDPAAQNPMQHEQSGLVYGPHPEHAISIDAFSYPMADRDFRVGRNV